MPTSVVPVSVVPVASQMCVIQTWEHADGPDPREDPPRKGGPAVATTSFVGVAWARAAFCILLCLHVTLIILVSIFYAEDTVHLSVGLSLFGFLLGMLITHCSPRRLHHSRVQPEPREPRELLHWVEGSERRGCGDLITKVNHIAIIVSDVGRSLAFYTDVIGFQQIRRPNFDRHGAWLTMGNLELHLIKGRPVVHDGEDLIVSHVALETEHPDAVLDKLISMGVPFRQNVSVPDPKKSAENNGAEDFSSSTGKVIQFFVRDPDGYYLELCNCDILTKFCLEKEDKIAKNNKLNFYAEGWAKQKKLKISLLFKIVTRLCRLKQGVRENLNLSFENCLRKQMRGVRPASVVDEDKLERLMKRTKTYCDITQGYSRKQLEQALLLAGNNVPLALLVLKADRGERRVCIPPSYLLCQDDREVSKDVNHSLQPRQFSMKVVRDDIGSSKPFRDREASKNGKRAQANILRLRQKVFGGRAGTTTDHMWAAEDNELLVARAPSNSETLRQEILDIANPPVVLQDIP